MKKWLMAIVIFLFVVIAGTYFFIPGELRVSKIMVINSPKAAGIRFLLDEGKWHKWWPQQASQRNKTFSYQGYTYHIEEFFSDKIRVLVTKEADSIHTIINILPLEKNSLTLRWECSVGTSSNPFERIRRYREARALRNNMSSILLTLQEFLEKNSNIYGYPIGEIISKDSLLIATRYVSDSYPGTGEIYRLIDTMRRYISANGAVETNYPMLRIIQPGNSHFETMVAIPINKMLAGNGSFFLQHFVPWKTLTGPVRGGTYTIDQAFKQMQNYVEDHQRTSMAVPFQSLVTDRRARPDTLEWITIICQPVS